MKTCYFDRETRAIADLVAPLPNYGIGYVPAWQITRINVPFQSRGAGLASALLKQITDDADSDCVDLWLGVLPTDGLNREQLIAWYERNGFRQHKNGMMVRRWVGEDVAVPVATFETLTNGAAWGYGEGAGQMTRRQADDLQAALDWASRLLERIKT